MKTVFHYLLALIVLISLSSWGYNGHKSISSHITYYFPSDFNQFQSWSSTLTDHASDADNRKSADPDESPKHFIDIENYKEFQQTGTVLLNLTDAIAKYGSSNVYAWGILPWATKTTYDTLVSCFRRNDLSKAVLTAADLGHYVADGHMPLHVTSNYDGQFTGNKGVHSRYETKMVDAYVSSMTYSPCVIHRINDVQQYILDYIYQSHTLVDTVLKSDTYAKSIDPSYGTAYVNAMYNKLGVITNALFQSSSVSIASLIYTAWQESQTVSATAHIVADMDFLLSQNVPNPFSDVTTIRYKLNKEGYIQLFVTDITGKKLATLVNEHQSQGEHSIRFTSNGLKSGVYLIVLQHEQLAQTKRMIIQSTNN
ncbi:MAG: T9SS type A sorting domain-containing protein [Microbacter sp.]